MLNPTFSKAVQKRVQRDYVAPQEVAKIILSGNESNATGLEHRFQSVYGDEIWKKLNRAGFPPSYFNDADVLEVCAGTGFLTYHLLSRSTPSSLTVNDISEAELLNAKKFIGHNYPKSKTKWILGDLHTVKFNRKFDIIIGNSFIHHFHNVPVMLDRFASLLKTGGVFISLHEPTPMATVLESGKLFAWPLAVLAPVLMNDISRYRYNGMPSSTDLWMFEPNKLKNLAKRSGFSDAYTNPWGLARPLVVNRHKLHLSEKKPLLTEDEEKIFSRAINLDAVLNRVLPHRCFGSISLICRR